MHFMKILKAPYEKYKGYISNIKYRKQHDYINYYYEHKEKFENRRSSINSVFNVRLI